MTVRKNMMVDSKLVTIEPGNATRYNFLISQTDEMGLTVVDLYSKQVFTLDKEWLYSDMAENHITVQMLNAGYSLGDTNPTAPELLQVLLATATITYLHDGETEVEWFDPNEDRAYQKQNERMAAFEIPKMDYRIKEHFNKRARYMVR